jgi:hypothetical protein
MVRFPETGDWQDSGEGGLFVMMVVVKPMTEEGFDDRTRWDTYCNVDVPIHLGRPDVCVSSERRLLWEPYDYNTSSAKAEYEVNKILDEVKRPELKRWLFSTRSSMEDSVELLMALHLGSTSASLHSESAGHYFCAEYKDLSKEGRGLYDTAKAAYGIEPLILTFLDT